MMVGWLLWERIILLVLEYFVNTFVSFSLVKLSLFTNEESISGPACLTLSESGPLAELLSIQKDYSKILY